MGALLDVLRNLSLGNMEKGIFAHIIKNDPLFPNLPAKTITADPYKYSRQLTLPPTGPVGSDGEIPEGVPTVTPVVVSIKRYAGQTPYDNFDLATTGDINPNQIDILLGSIAQSISHTIGHDLVHGDSSVDLLRFDGLNKIAAGLPATQRLKTAATGGTNAIALRDLWLAASRLRAGKLGAFAIAHPSALVAIQDKFSTDTSAAMKMTPNFDGSEVFHFGRIPIFESDFVSVTEDVDGVDGAGALTSLYIVGAGPQGLQALIPEGQGKAALVEIIGQREKKAGGIVRGQIHLGLALHSAYALVRLTSIDPTA